MSKKVSLSHILRPGRKAVSEVLDEVKVWNEGFTRSKLERTHSKLTQFLQQCTKPARPTERHAVIIFLAFWEVMKGMINTLKVADKEDTVASIAAATTASTMGDASSDSKAAGYPDQKIGPFI